MNIAIKSLEDCLLTCGVRLRKPKIPPDFARRHGLEPPFSCDQIGAFLVFCVFTLFSFGILTFSFQNIVLRWATTAWMILWAITFYPVTFIAVSTIDPAGVEVRKKVYGNLQPKFEKDKFSHVIKIYEEGIVWCHICQVEATPDFKHCRTCNKCIKRFDHHCTWLNNCIGEENYPMFILYLLISLTTNAALTILSVCHIVFGALDSTEVIRYQMFGYSQTRFVWLGFVIATTIFSATTWVGLRNWPFIHSAFIGFISLSCGKEKQHIQPKQETISRIWKQI